MRISDWSSDVCSSDLPELFPNPKSATDTLRAVAEAKAWTSLLNVQIDPTYRALVGEVLESVRPRVEAVDPGMCHRGGWIFITSPHTVTPFHFDKEHNLLLQINGSNRIYVWQHHHPGVAPGHSPDLSPL